MTDVTSVGFFAREMPTGGSTAYVKPAPKPGDRVTAEEIGSIGTVVKVYGQMAPYLLADHAEVSWDDGSYSHEPINELTVQSPATPERTQQ